MWIPKFQRDRNKGVDSPMPTQAVSNEEFIPRPQTEQQKQVEHLIGEIGTRNAKRLGMKRRDFMRSTMGLATAFWASNQVYGQHWDVDEAETLEPAAYAEKWHKGEYFIMDVQGHFTDNVAIGSRSYEFIRNMGFELDASPEAYSFENFFKEMYLDSETDIVVISGVPGREKHRDEHGKLLEGKAREGGVLPSRVMSKGKKDINERAGGQRALCQGNVAPNHYWDRVANKQDKAMLKEVMEREAKLYGIDSWKLYCHTDPARTGRGFQLDDEETAYFYEVAREVGVKIVSVHKGFASQSRTFGHLANPKDVEKAALDNPDLTFVIYHSAMKHGPHEATFKTEKFYDPTTGDFEWHDVLMNIKRRHPEMNNVYPEIGTSFGLTAIANPEMAQHLMAKNIKYYGADHVLWGTDCIWWGSPQWAIDSFKRFQISDELCEKFGYQKITKEDKAKIFGLNAAKIYGVDVETKRKELSKDTLARMKRLYDADKTLQRSNAAYGWVRAD